ncbi:hypothetical protein [Halodesulfovibrio spirochaetisodalis]|uniref:Uncharacterized protein n=1 Tax=Halodesulfovibrio spirochaetisodalis TaxID=1560234 RepID=A0A1B7XB73_9BACT|nr:hypothetical protein [Halodesulfovibrio spirochaetisodalis]OBQ46612.1 hypothetical protein SP90_11445 [Halodesulfovibrio spirochaetisodalis]
MQLSGASNQFGKSFSEVLKEQLDENQQKTNEKLCQHNLAWQSASFLSSADGRSNTTPEATFAKEDVVVSRGAKAMLQRYNVNKQMKYISIPVWQGC